MSKLTITCTDWKPRRRNTLCGFARIHISELGLTVHDVAIHEKADRRWAQLPAKPWIREGALVLGDDGRPQYSPLLEFTRREVRDAFSQRVIEAVIRFDPNALALEEAAT